ncbi:MAG: TIGR04282 family arsenosugar biosynthesis glycosyltransferase [Gemmatimonadota bacterium]|nr:MAG: TIGR04282 family arsenosugar biosynthesis glycosyltransferase [Gemmatimonadota bacterium]
MPREYDLGERIIVLTRYPEPGKTKTRLIPALGEEGAAELQRYMTEDTLACVLAAKKDHPLHVEVRYEGGNAELIEQWLGKDVSYCSQGNGDLGQRMARAFTDAFQSGMTRVVLTGTDCPDMTEDIIRAGLDALYHKDCVIGPSKDGGYYLIGFRDNTFVTDVFEDMPWGSRTVFKETLQILEKRCHEVYLLPELNDIDTVDDIREFMSGVKTNQVSITKTITFLLQWKWSTK